MNESVSEAIARQFFEEHGFRVQRIPEAPTRRSDFLVLGDSSAMILVSDQER